MKLVEFIVLQGTRHGVPHVVACRALGVSESWFYKWRSRGPSERQKRRDRLDAAVREAFERSGGRYGSPRVHAELRADGWPRLSVNSVAASMARQGLCARPKHRRRALTRAARRARAFPDLLGRNFTVGAPNVAGVGDLTEIPTREGPLYLATFIDLFARTVSGFAMSEHHDAQVAQDALAMVVAFRGGIVPGMVFHSDRGSEYDADAYRQACERVGVVQSMGRVGSALDNAVAESFNSTLEFEVLARSDFATRAEARLVVATWIIDMYNLRRRHSSAGMLPPLVFEAKMADIVAVLLGWPPRDDDFASTRVDKPLSSIYIDASERQAAG